MASLFEPSYLKTVLDSFPACLAILAKTGEILYVNESWNGFIKTSRKGFSNCESWFGENFLSIFGKGSGIDDFYAQKAIEGIQGVLDQSIPRFHFEYPITDQNSGKWFFMILEKIEGIPETYLAVQFEITKYKIAEERTQVFATLLEHQSDGTKFLLQEPDGSYAILAMLEQSSEGLALTDSNYTVIFANKSLAVTHGYQPGELIGQDLRVLFDTEETKFRHLRLPDQEDELSFDGEIVNKRKDGTSFPTATYKRALISSNVISGYVWTFHDISKLKQSEFELNRRAEELEAKIRQLNCLYQISELKGRPHITLAELLQGIVELIPDSTRYPNKIGAIIKVGGEVFKAGPVDQKSWERSFEINVEDKVLATLTICFASHYQGDETYEIFDDELSLIRVVGEHLGRLIERYGLVAELEQYSKDQYVELSQLELVSGPSLTPVSTQTYGQGTLKESQPEEFKILTGRYEEALDLILDQKTYKVDHKISEHLRNIASEIGFLRGGPRDIVEIHSAAVRNKTEGVPKQRAKVYLTEGKFMAFGLLGHLTSFYRNRALFVTKK